jgi:hypothetical protein
MLSTFVVPPYVAHKMAPSLLVPDHPDKDTGEDNQEVKKQKTLPHWGKRLPVIEGFLDGLSSASESVTKFNKEENRANRNGLKPIHMGRLKKALDVNALDAKLNEIDSYLADVRAVYVDYIDRIATEDENVQREVKLSLGDITWEVQELREQLPGIFFTR